MVMNKCGYGVRVHTRDRARWVGSEDSPASVPVVVVVAVPTGPLPVRHRWARRQWWSKVLDRRDPSNVMTTDEALRQAVSAAVEVVEVAAPSRVAVDAP